MAVWGRRKCFVCATLMTFPYVSPLHWDASREKQSSLNHLLKTSSTLVFLSSPQRHGNSIIWCDARLTLVSNQRVNHNIIIIFSWRMLYLEFINPCLLLILARLLVFWEACWSDGHGRLHAFLRDRRPEGDSAGYKGPGCKNRGAM